MKPHVWTLSNAPPLKPREPGETTHREAIDQEPVRWRELVAVALLVILADLTLYRGHGYSGNALLFALAPLLLLIGAPRAVLGAPLWILGAMLLALAVKLVWFGTGLQVTAGWILTAAFTMSLAGLIPSLGGLLLYVSQVIPAGCFGLVHYGQSADRLSFGIPRATWLKVVLPAAAVLCFGTLFVLANPDVAAAVSRTIGESLKWISERLQWLVPRGTEIFFWFAAAWIIVGLLRPMLPTESFERHSAEAAAQARAPAEASLYASYRNTLVAVAVLFAVYLIFEFATLWFREFPQGFYYSGYAHEGAAWLTVALALATAVLSLIFRGAVLDDPRLPLLRRWAWIWSAENLLLALAVYNRLHIYVRFNGMTRMRVVGLLGMTAVVAGFVLVIWKITHGRNFAWLVRRHVWTVAVAVYLYALLPVDTLVHAYNVRRILAGDPAPAVQLSVHPLDAGGVLVLQPLVHTDDPLIREGIRALLAQKAEQAETLAQQRTRLGWTSFQLADHLLLRKLSDNRADWQGYTDHALRKEALERFHQYVYQWY